MSLISILKKALAPEPIKSDDVSSTRSKTGDAGSDEITANEVLKTLKTHFLQTIAKLSTDYNFLFHTSFTLYIKARNYAEISESLPFLAGGAEKMLLSVIREEIAKRKLGNYRPHSQYWQFQLVEIPPEAELDGLDKEELSDGAFIQINSTLFPPSEGDDPSSDSDNRVVTTVQGVNSLRAIRNCINPEILSRLYLVEKDRIKLDFVLDEDRKDQGFAGRAGMNPAPCGNHGNTATRSRNPAAEQPPQRPRAAYFATLEAQDGEFLEGAGNKKIHTVAMTAEELHIVGRSSMPGGRGVEVVRVNSDRVLTPHVKIRRDPSTGRFEIMPIGPTSLNERTLTPNSDQWRPLPDNSTILLADEVQIKFKAAVKQQ